MKRKQCFYTALLCVIVPFIRPTMAITDSSLDNETLYTFTPQGWKDTLFVHFCCTESAGWQTNVKNSGKTCYLYQDSTTFNNQKLNPKNEEIDREMSTKLTAQLGWLHFFYKNVKVNVQTEIITLEARPERIVSLYILLTSFFFLCLYKSIRYTISLNKH